MYKLTETKKIRELINLSTEDAEEIRKLRAENARLREQNDIAVHFVRWVIQWESDPDVKSLAQYMIDNAKLTLKEINKSTPPSQAENARLREAIESQPHSWDCATQVPPESPCDCWKSRALENVSKSSESK